ncbi:TIM44-related membrane protein TimA [Caulobacter ginsengisoli]|nr:TIM44-related membrane protein TimA [Caulobacter ginsengisoli]
MIELIILAVLAGVVLYQLYSVLGRRVGRQPEDMPAPALPDSRAPAPEALEGVELTGLAAVKARDPSFEVGQFLNGARAAYEMVVKAFAEGDRETLKRLLAPHVLAGFETAMAEREAQGRSERVDFLQTPRADLDGVETEGTVARAKVRFLGEYRARSKGPEGEAVDDRRTAELWTFQRNLNSRDPNWTLVQVDPAEA